MAETVITETDGGSTQLLEAGETLSVRLSEIPSTGFRWFLATVDTNILAPQADEFQLEAHSGVGSGGLRVFRFIAKHPGQLRLEFKLIRQWESGPPRALLTVTVNVVPRPN